MTPDRSMECAFAVALSLAGCAATAGAESDTDVDDDGSSSTTAGTTTTTAATDGTAAHEGEDGASGAGDTNDPSSESSGSIAPGCGNAIVDVDEDCDDGNDDPFDGCRSDCTAVELLDPPPLEWTYFEIEGTRCLDGSPAGFGVSYNPDSPDVMIYLEGGGACFDDGCDFTAFSAPFSPPSDGIFSRDDDNPVGDWTMIHVPYCSGDIHAGSAEAMLGGKLRHFYGFDNITRYLERWVPSFTGTQTVLLTGSSAGGFGAALNADQVADAYGDDVQIVVVDDSGPPLSSDVMPPCLQEKFRGVWGLDDTVLAGCPSCDPHDFASDLFDAVLTEHPSLRFGLFSYHADLVIRTYMGFGWNNGAYDQCTGIPTPVPWLTYNDDLVATRASHEDAMSTFYVHGFGHTVLRPGFDSTSVDGITLAQWLADVIAGEHVHAGP